MPSNTEKLGLYKANPATDGEMTFNIDLMLNDNWDKLDAEAKTLSGRIDTIGSELAGKKTVVVIPEGSEIAPSEREENTFYFKITESEEE